MYGGHEALYETEFIVEDFGDRCETVCGAGCVRYELCALYVCVLVDTAYEHGSVILGGGGHNHILGAGVDVTLRFLFGQEEAGGFNHVFGSLGAPADLLRVAAGRYLDFLAVYNQDTALQIVVNGAVETSVHCVILQHVGHVVYGKKVVDCHNLDVVSLCGGAEHETSDTAESVNTNLCHCLISFN